MRLIARCPTKTDLESTFLDPTIVTIFVYEVPSIFSHYINVDEVS